MGEPPAVTLDDLGLSARLRQTLQGLLAGEAEKQIANRLDLSPHTVHVYVKGLYRHFGVSSRGELLARFVRSHPAAN
jgi:DNA-binding NarL/FixJ family response regulator